MLRTTWIRIARIASALSIATLLVSGCVAAATRRRALPRPPAQTVPRRLRHRSSSKFVAVVRQTQPSVAQIQTDQGLGSGVIFDTKGDVVTNAEILVSRHKREVFDELIDEVRRSQSATDRFDQAVADALGLNRTDFRCLDVLEHEGPMTAGRLADATGLTTGAMTTALDRLERAGYARRVRDSDDRRRILVELTPQAGAKASRFYAEHAAQAERLYHRYSTQELELLLRFVREGREFNERHAARLEDRHRTRPPSQTDPLAPPAGAPNRSQR